jgi:defect-in-organelle-trafficking protein DotA
MVSFFQWVPQDQSIYYLSQLFGYMDNVLPVAEGTTTIIAAMLKVINTTALVIGSILIIITTIRGLLKTAQEGEFLGKEWSSLWVPVRTLVGIASLFPTAAGYSLLQIALMWVIVQGIGAADTLWTTVLQYVTVAGSPYSVVTASNNVTPISPSSSSSSNAGSPSSITIPQLMQNLFYALTCQETLARTDGDTYTDSNTGDPDPLYYCNKFATTDPFCATSFDDRTKITNDTSTKLNYFTFTMGPGGVCGNMQFPNPLYVSRQVTMKN